MTLPNEMLSSLPFQYALSVRNGDIVVGKRIKQAVERFFRWIDEADGVLVPGAARGEYIWHPNTKKGHKKSGYYIDHSAGMHIVNFYPMFLNHTTGKMAGQPFHLAPFQAFTMYNVFGWKKLTGSEPDRKKDRRRIRTVYDKRAKKNGKSAEMAGLSIYVMGFDDESEAQVYVGATKEEQARICWKQAKSFVDSHAANPILRKSGFYTQQKVVGYKGTGSVMMPLGGDSKTQDGINAHLAIIDEYHAHKDDGVKGNLASSMGMRSQPILWHITTAGTNIYSACRRYETGVIEVLEGREEIPHLFIMIHDLDDDDNWEDKSVWCKANPLLGQGLELERIEEEYLNTKINPSEIPNFKTKHLNMWVDAPTIWIPNEIWMANKHDLTPEEVADKFKRFGGYSGADLSTKLDITAYILLSEPDEHGHRYIVPRFFCPNENIVRRSTEDKVPYVFWRDQGYLIATTGNVVDYNRVEAEIYDLYTTHNIHRVEFDPWNASALISNLMDRNITVGELPQNMSNLSEPTKEFEMLVISGRIKHDGNPVLAWMLAGCTPIYDTKGNMMIAKGRSIDGAKRRIDGIAATINALAGSMSGPSETNESVYNNPDVKFWC